MLFQKLLPALHSCSVPLSTVETRDSVRRGTFGRSRACSPQQRFNFSSWYCDKIKWTFVSRSRVSINILAVLALVQMLPSKSFLQIKFIYVSQNVCGATPGIPININLNGCTGLKVSPKNVTFLCVSSLGWQRNLSASVVIMTETL